MVILKVTRNELNLFFSPTALCQVTVICGVHFSYKIHKDVQLSYLSLNAAT